MGGSPPLNDPFNLDMDLSYRCLTVDLVHDCAFPDLLRDEAGKFFYAVPRAAADPEEGCAGIDGPVVGKDPFFIKIKIREHIIFVQGQAVGICEHERILLHFVIAFRNTQDRDAKGFADPEFRRADQIPDIFHKDYIKVFKRQFGKDMLNAHGLDVAGPVRVELDGGHAERSDSPRPPGRRYPLQ